MKVTADTNVLIRAAVQDDLHQARRAVKILAEADLVAVPVPVLCEFVWELRRGYKKSVTDVCDAIRRPMRSANLRSQALTRSTHASLMNDLSVRRTLRDPFNLTRILIGR